MNKERDVPGLRRRLRDILLTHLRAAGAPAWPGTDSLTVEEVLLSYPQAAADGLVPDCQTLRDAHPELADLLDEFFASHHAVRPLSGP